MGRVALGLSVLLATAAAITPALVGATPPQRSSGLRYGHVSVRGDPYTFALYVPSASGVSAAAALVVVLHGCNATDSAQARATGYDQLAERYRFVVLYPDVDAADARAGRCWKALWDPGAEGRGHGDAGAIAAMTRAVMTRRRIDRRRVYAIGMSSGGFEASVLGADYPDLYTAIGIHSGAAYMGAKGSCFSRAPSAAATRALALEALRAMGRRARVMPVVIFHGGSDRTIPYRCGRQALAQWLATDDLVLHRLRIARPAGSRITASEGAVSGGHTYTVRSIALARGCTVLQLWTIHDMRHYWSGGSADPLSARYTDPRGPSATAASWAFFSPLRLSARVGEMCRRR